MMVVDYFCIIHVGVTPEALASGSLVAVMIVETKAASEHVNPRYVMIMVAEVDERYYVTHYHNFSRVLECQMKRL